MCTYIYIIYKHACLHINMYFIYTHAHVPFRWGAQHERLSTQSRRFRTQCTDLSLDCVIWVDVRLRTFHWTMYELLPRVLMLLSMPDGLPWITFSAAKAQSLISSASHSGHSMPSCVTGGEAKRKYCSLFIYHRAHRKDLHSVILLGMPLQWHTFHRNGGPSCTFLHIDIPHTHTHTNIQTNTHIHAYIHILKPKQNTWEEGDSDSTAGQGGGRGENK